MGAIDLETHLNSLIAEIDGVNAEDVTVEYIRQQREKRIYPDTRFEAPPGLICLTRNEWLEIEVIVDEILARI